MRHEIGISIVEFGMLSYITRTLSECNRLEIVHVDSCYYLHSFLMIMTLIRHL